MENNAKIEKAGNAAFDLAEVRSAIEASHRQYSKNFLDGDLASFGNHYTSDACVFPTHFSKMCGTEAINAFFNQAYAMGIRNIKLTPIEIMGGPNEVIETGIYELLADGDFTVDKGKFIVIWKKEHGNWKMYRDIWNTDSPAAPSA